MTEPLLAEPHAKSRMKTLDAFRGIAIIAVVLFHYSYRWGPLDGDGFNLYHFRQNYAWFADGLYGVQFFFIISGFVIFMTLEHCRDWREFGLRRFGRLYPVYIVCMLVTFFVTRWIGPPDFHRPYHDLLIGFTMMSDEFHTGWIDGACWSLLMEILFYVWVGLIFFTARKFFAPVWAVFCVAARIVAHRYPETGQFFLAAPFLCYFTAGMAFYSLYAKRPLYITVIFFVTAFYLYYRFWRHSPLDLQLLVLAMMVAFTLFVSAKLEWLGGGVLGYVGLVSYPLYLLHQNIGVSLIARFNNVPELNGWPAIAATSAIMFTAAIAVHYMVELPAHSLVRRFSKGRPAMQRAAART